MGTMSDHLLLVVTYWAARKGRTSNDQVRSQNGHTAHTDTGFGCSIGGAEASEDDGGGAAEGAEEGLSGYVSCCYEVGVVDCD